MTLPSTTPDNAWDERNAVEIRRYGSARDIDHAASEAYEFVVPGHFRRTTRSHCAVHSQGVQDANCQLPRLAAAIQVSRCLDSNGGSPLPRLTPRSCLLRTRACTSTGPWRWHGISGIPSRISASDVAGPHQGHRRRSGVREDSADGIERRWVCIISDLPPDRWLSGRLFLAPNPRR